MFKRKGVGHRPHSVFLLLCRRKESANIRLSVALHEVQHAIRSVTTSYGLAPAKIFVSSNLYLQSSSHDS